MTAHAGRTSESGTSVDYSTLVEDSRVHSRVYTDPTIFADELDKIFSRGWVYVIHESQLPSPNSYVSTRIGLTPVACTRDQAGDIHVLINRCAHRGNTLCQDEHGSSRFLQCSYHGWTYRFDGRLVGVPYPAGYGSGFDKSQFGLTRVPRVAAYRGFVFASFAPDGITLDEHLGDSVKEQIDLFVDLSPEGEVALNAGSLKYFYRGNWKLTLENTVDGYHPQFVHETWLEAIARHNGLERVPFGGDQPGQYTRDLGRGHGMLDLREFKAAQSDVRGRAFPTDNDPYLAAVRPGTDDLARRSHPDVFPTVTPEDEAAYVTAMERAYGPRRARTVMAWAGTHLAVFPNLFLVGGAVRTSRPVSVDRTEIIAAPALLRGVPQVINTVRIRGFENFFGAAGSGHPDDVEMWERTMLGLQAGEAWLDMRRGVGRERVDGDGTVFAEITDELPMRGIYGHWQRLMTTS